jgi:uncharacterized repeat protein (TIGR03803 family)
MRITSELPHSLSKVQRRVATTAGTALMALVTGLMATPSAQAQIFKVLYTFEEVSHGKNPAGGLVRDAAGNLYGTTIAGGDFGYGTIFKLSTSGQETALHSFGSVDNDGIDPMGDLFRDGAGNLYGTTENGGTYNHGAVFKLNANGAYSVLYSFTGGADGGYPLAGVIRDAAGNLYGTTLAGGVSRYGTVFRLNTTGEETVLHSFGPDKGGDDPMGGLIEDAAGNLYGTASEGGDLDCNNIGFGCGTVFKLSATSVYTVLYTFRGETDGGLPLAGLILDAEGNLYGTTSMGGELDCDAGFGCGTVFKLDSAGNETVLYSFIGGIGGSSPQANLVRDAAGNLYGTTGAGGDLSCLVGGDGCGIVFKLHGTGQLDVLHRFHASGDGAYANAGLLLDRASGLYGPTSEGGDLNCNTGFGCGTIFEITP